MNMNIGHQKDYNTLAQRVCPKCKQLKPLNYDHFYRDASRPHGYYYTCKVCHNSKKESRIDRYKKMSFEQKTAKKETYNKYMKTTHGRAIYMSRAYKKIDKAKGYENDVTVTFLIMEIFPKPCIYCGTIDEGMGCDRINNKIGHMQINVVPCCTSCNRARGDHFTFDEMLILGETIRKIKEMRIDFQRRLPG